MVPSEAVRPDWSNFKLEIFGKGCGCFGPHPFSFLYQTLSNYQYPAGMVPALAPLGNEGRR
jgi:hypothetical protein